MKREQVHSVPSVEVGHNDDHRDHHESTAPEVDELESFQLLVAAKFNHLLASSCNEDLLSLVWIRKLLDAFLCCLEEFRVILFNNKTSTHLADDFFERSLKALDICNATRDGIERIKQWQRHLEIVLSALDSRQRVLGDGQLRRARKALVDLTLAMLDEKEGGSAFVFSHRNRSFGRHNNAKDHHRPGHSRSLSWSVSRSWSAAKQLQSIVNNLVPPRANEIATTNGFAISVFTMTWVLLFVLWAIVAAIPCQDRGLQIHFNIPHHFPWGSPILLMHDKIMEESKKREKRNSNGLLKEIHQIEIGARQMMDLVDSAHPPLSEQQKTKVEQGVQELALVCEVLQNGLDPLERHVREVFHRIMSCRTDGLELLGPGSSAE
ncbi:Protein ROH1-like [Dillenia turbinata]|uniref:Protein ROH1-like n=1 Tax=Dillenia turbinata TaxID=194707 RepID=A0AAN8Z0B9_9MAGN